MCEFCSEDGEMARCQDCGRLICFDVQSGDDVLRPAFVTSSGDVYCNVCGKETEREEEEIMDREDWGYVNWGEDNGYPD